MLFNSIPQTTPNQKIKVFPCTLSKYELSKANLLHPKTVPMDFITIS